jgi:hypothetical protein
MLSSRLRSSDRLFVLIIARQLFLASRVGAVARVQRAAWHLETSGMAWHLETNSLLVVG